MISTSCSTNFESGFIIHFRHCEEGISPTKQSHSTLMLFVTCASTAGFRPPLPYGHDVSARFQIYFKYFFSTDFILSTRGL
jgi:hypothetical protein